MSRITQRQSVITLLIILIIADSLISVSLLFQIGVYGWMLPIVSSSALVSYGVLLFAYWRRWEPARYVLLAMVTLLIGLATPEPFITKEASITLFIPAALALILAEPAWVIGSTVLVYVMVLVRAGGQGVYANPVTIGLYGIVVGGIVVGRLITDTAQQDAENNARQVAEEKTRVEAQARELADANELMSVQLDQQGQLLDLVATLETPAVPLADGVLFAPIVGHIDTRRAQALTNRLLQDVSEQRARLVVLDMAGVTVMDTVVAKALMNTTQAIRLLGCDVTLSGISASIALTLIHLGVNLDGIATARSPQEALAQHFSAATVPLMSNGNGKSHYN